MKAVLMFLALCLAWDAFAEPLFQPRDRRSAPLYTTRNTGGQFADTDGGGTWSPFAVDECEIRVLPEGMAGIEGQVGLKPVLLSGRRNDFGFRRESASLPSVRIPTSDLPLTDGYAKERTFRAASSGGMVLERLSYERGRLEYTERWPTSGAVIETRYTVVFSPDGRSLHSFEGEKRRVAFRSLTRLSGGNDLGDGTLKIIDKFICRGPFRKATASY